MKIRAQKGSVLCSPAAEADDITYVACIDQFGQVFAVIEEIGVDTYHVATRADEQFASILKRLGLGEPVPMREVTSGLPNT